MKIYTCPKEVPAPHFSVENWQEAEEKHSADLKNWLLTHGYPGARTGEIYRTPVADGYALYMVGDAGRGKAILIHLPYGDAYDSRDVAYIPQKEIFARIDAEKAFRAKWSKK